METKMTKEEALNKVRQMSLPKETMEILEALAPELAESEDERIRKALIDGVRQIRCKNGITQEQMIAYLEKQKEQKPVEIHVDNPNIEKFDPDVKITTSDSSADGKELLYVCNKSYDIGFRDGVASVKPVEWSEEEFHKTTKLVYRAIRKALSSLAVYAEDEALLDSKEETLCYYSQHCAEEIFKSINNSRSYDN